MFLDVDRTPVGLLLSRLREDKGNDNMAGSTLVEMTTLGVQSRGRVNVKG